MVEGGANVISSFLKSGLVDSFLLTIAPVYVGKDGVSAVEDAEVNIFGLVDYRKSEEVMQICLKAMILI